MGVWYLSQRGEVGYRDGGLVLVTVGEVGYRDGVWYLSQWEVVYRDGGLVLVTVGSRV